VLNIATQDIIKSIIKIDSNYTRDQEAIEAIESISEDESQGLYLFNNQGKFSPLLYIHIYINIL
jgi:hypothetical protein